MGKSYRYWFVFCVFCFLFFQEGWGQNNDPIPWKRDTIIKDNVFKIYSNWLSGGGGVGQSSLRGKMPQFVGGVDYNFHIQDKYFQVGVLVSGDAYDNYGFFQYSNYTNYELHACLMKRYETAALNFSYCGGLAVSEFYIWNDTQQQYDLNKTVKLYLCAQLIRKITYDVGVGLDVFADVNMQQSLFGARAVLFFCGSYKGKKADLY